MNNSLTQRTPGTWRLSSGGMSFVFIRLHTPSHAHYVLGKCSVVLPGLTGVPPNQFEMKGHPHANAWIASGRRGCEWLQVAKVVILDVLSLQLAASAQQSLHPNSIECHNISSSVLFISTRASSRSFMLRSRCLAPVRAFPDIVRDVFFIVKRDRAFRETLPNVFIFHFFHF